MNETLDAYLPHDALIVDRIDESPTIFTLRLKFTDPVIHDNYKFRPGQFNMLYLHGVGEIAISIVSDPKNSKLYDHTIRVVGRVTKGFAKLKPGDHIGVRGPYGKGWPLRRQRDRDILIITGGLGCAPVVAVINYIFKRRERYGKVFILQGVKHSDDLIYRQRYQEWNNHPDTTVLITADEASHKWPWYKGTTVELLPKITLDPQNTSVMMCGPEIMMKITAKELLAKGLDPNRIFLSMERNMQCGIGHCGHCQYGDFFICKDGPVFAYPKVKSLFMKEGF